MDTAAHRIDTVIKEIASVFNTGYNVITTKATIKMVLHITKI